MRRGGWVLLLLLIAPIVAAQSPGSYWSQVGGDGFRSGIAPAPAAPLDVVGSYSILEGGEFLLGSFRVADTTRGLVSIATPGGPPIQDATCMWVRVEDPRAGGVTRPGTLPCARTALNGYDLGNDVLYACTSGAPAAAALAAYEGSTLRELWRSPAPEIETVSSWNCGSALLDFERERAVVAWGASAGSGNSVVAVDLPTGRTLWSREIPTTALMSGLIGGPPQQLRSDAFLPVSTTHTTTGYVVVGTIATVSPPEVGIVWLDLDGEIRGGATGRGLENSLFYDPDARRRPIAYSHAAASGTEAALVLGETIFAVDPSRTNPSQYPHDVPPSDAILPRPVWRGPLFVAPTHSGLVAYDAAGFAHKWSWGGIPSGALDDVIATEEGELLVLTSAPSADGTKLYVSRLDAATGREIHRLVLPRSAEGPFGAGARFAPLARDGALLVVTSLGEVIVLDRLDPTAAPRIELDDEYPLPQSSIRASIVANRTEPVVSTIIAWGDGVVEEVPGRADATYRYAEDGPVTLRMTVVHADGRTATAERVVHVGQTPPETLTAIQRAFSRENQEITFFVLGLALTGGGALFAAVLRRQRHARLAREERLLRTVIDAALLDPTPGLAALEKHRAHLRDAHTRRRLDDAQFALLDQRTVRAMKSARYRLLGGTLNKLSPHFRRVLDTALEDGQVTHGEMAALIATLDEETRLDEREREKLRALLSAWAR